jgi:hypothetical protein
MSTSSPIRNSYRILNNTSDSLSDSKFHCPRLYAGDTVPERVLESDVLRAELIDGLAVRGLAISGSVVVTA